MGQVVQFVVGALASGAGKTTLSLGLMGALCRTGKVVQPFKCGPDYIDSAFHSKVCRRSSINLDLFMASERHVKHLFGYYSCGADAVVVEGMMGLFDGYSRDKGSTAHIAKTLGLPVILIVDARSCAYTLAPLIRGIIDFKDSPRIAGIIFNRVGSEHHVKTLHQVCKDIGTECLGLIPRCAGIEHPSRYLGLDLRTESPLDEIINVVTKYVDLERLEALTSTPLRINFEQSQTFLPFYNTAIAFSPNCDAFTFLYKEHFDKLHNLGPVTLFDPTKNEPLPADTTLLYLPGGYPERHIRQLCEANHTISSIRDYAKRGGCVLAECGGMIFLCRYIITDDGKYRFAGVLPYSIMARKESFKLTLGYRKMTLGKQILKGHEFHYTQFSDPEPQSSLQVFDAEGTPVSTPLFRQGNVIASYTHFYLGEIDLRKLFNNTTLI